MIAWCRRRWFGRRRKPRCPECFRRSMAVWAQEIDLPVAEDADPDEPPPMLRRGGQWCQKCGYGWQPPTEEETRALCAELGVEP